MTNDFARTLRRGATDAERELWKRLRHRQVSGLKFRRQVPIGPYVCDFACHQRRLVIELDGGQHAEQLGYDATRTSFLQDRGYSVIRFWNGDVFTRPKEVEAMIRAALGEEW